MNVKAIEEIIDQEIRPTPEFSTPSSLVFAAAWLTIHAHIK